MRRFIVFLIIVIAIGAVLFFYVTRPPSAPSESAQSALRDINNPPLSGTTSPQTITYRISPTHSTVVFKIGEILRGNPYTAYGTTTNVAGDITISDNTVSIGTIAVNARTFKTDDARRDGAITRLILRSEDAANEFIYFRPTNISIPSTSTPIGPGSRISFNAHGDLTISGITKPATFRISMNIGSSTVNGIATVDLKRSDYNLIIPNVPFVARVDDAFSVTAHITAQQ